MRLSLKGFRQIFSLALKWPLIWARPLIPHYLKIWTASILSILLGIFLVWASYATTLTGFDVTQTRYDGIALIGMPVFVLCLAIYVAVKLREKKTSVLPTPSLETVIE